MFPGFLGFFGWVLREFLEFSRVFGESLRILGSSRIFLGRILGFFLHSGPLGEWDEFGFERFPEFFWGGFGVYWEDLGFSGGPRRFLRGPRVFLGRILRDFVFFFFCIWGSLVVWDEFGSEVPTVFWGRFWDFLGVPFRDFGAPQVFGKNPEDFWGPF